MNAVLSFSASYNYYEIVVSQVECAVESSTYLAIAVELSIALGSSNNQVLKALL